MTQHEHPKIIAFVGLAGAGKTTAIEHFTENGFPKVNLAGDTAKAIEQIQHLIAAGQRHLVLDELVSWSDYTELKKAFPGELILIAVVAERHLRYHRLSLRETNSLTTSAAHERDIFEIEHLDKGGPIAVADHYVINNFSTEIFQNNVEQLADSIGF